MQTIGDERGRGCEEGKYRFCEVFGCCDWCGVGVSEGVDVFLLLVCVGLAGHCVWLRFGIDLRHLPRKILGMGGSGGVWRVSRVVLWSLFGA